jgi:hypothetical protein
MGKVILRTPMRTRSNSFSDALFQTHFSGMERGATCWSAKQDLLPKKSGDLYNVENVDHKFEDLYFFAFVKIL